MAQFVGREENYRGLFPSIYHVFKEEGLRGYFVYVIEKMFKILLIKFNYNEILNSFRGLIPRMVGEVLTLWFAQVATFVINTYIVEEKVLRSYIGTSLMVIKFLLFKILKILSTNSRKF